MTKSAGDVVKFWCEDHGPTEWFKKDDNFDAAIRTNFLSTYEEAAKGNLDHWAAEPDGLLALMILLDQFPRNMFREDAKAFATDFQALSLAKAAVNKDQDKKVPIEVRQFIYLPFEHSEDMADQVQSVTLMGTLNAGLLEWAEKHKVIIDEYGRFPHRNKALGRENTPEENIYLENPNSGF
jgi:uncharacterized protein (DUF924 family)